MYRDIDRTSIHVIFCIEEREIDVIIRKKQGRYAIGSFSEQEAKVNIPKAAIRINIYFFMF